MDLIKSLKPFNKDLDNWKAGHGFSDRNKLTKLVGIWHEFAQENVKEIYGSSNMKVERVELSCGTCVSDMLSFLYNWREILKKTLPKYHKMVPNIAKNKPEGDALSKMDWKDLIVLAKEKDIKTYRKKRPVIEQELRDLK